MGEDSYRDLVVRMSETDKNLSKLLGETQSLVKQNEQLINLLSKAIRYMFWIIVILIAALIYGAIGESGFNAVKGSTPIGAISSNIPGGDELSGWMRRCRV